MNSKKEKRRGRGNKRGALKADVREEGERKKRTQSRRKRRRGTGKVEEEPRQFKSDQRTREREEQEHKKLLFPSLTSDGLCS